MKSYLEFVSALAKPTVEARSLPLGGLPPCPRPQVAPDAPKVLFFAPHPDDETIQGGLMLRLLREAQWNAINVAVTQGSNKDRQAARYEELKEACNYLGFGLIQTAPNGLEKVTLKTRESDSALWTQMVKVIADILAAHKPKVIFFPHDQDWNGTHIGVHHLVMDALRSLPSDFTTYTVETEFWGQNDAPNLLVEYSGQDVADLMAGTSFHVGEVKRNPYHILIPAWMMDNVRRGAELVGGQGGAAPGFLFGQLFRLRKWSNGQLENVYSGGKNLSKEENAASLFA